ncbi:hypothetical protein NQ314_014399 [Rhamnusium bicolor]|uniref:Uncharacterized protein n=1 Tax=Rhamnusium bicolor TaxID=1586634 RepID=A0AAV8X372_9CUCU|nr:hypothetical protein NQ314_014399 [Rhamnusium bicolor]
MFLNTIGVTDKFVRVSLNKIRDSGVVQPDNSGRHIPKNKLPETVRMSVISHISSFPVYESHYSRARSKRKYLGPELNISLMYKLYVEKCKTDNIEQSVIAKEWHYRKIFNEEFNLSFYNPSNDTCDDCDYFLKVLKERRSEEETAAIMAQQKKASRRSRK